MNKRRLISFDWALKRLLRSKANYEVLEGFLTELLKQDIKILDILESESNKETAQDKFNLLKINQFDDVAKDTLDEWMYFLKHEEIKEDFTAKGLQKAKQVLDILQLSETERRAYENYVEDLHYQASMYLSSFGVGKLEGLAEGEKRNKINTARVMLQAGENLEKIMRYTQLNQTDIQQLKDDL